jgi:leucyl aminopeptidase (aminopeptidase T)
MKRAIEHLLCHCGGLRAGETVLVIADRTTAEIAPLFADVATARGGVGGVCLIPTADRHGVEPPDEVAGRMAAAGLVLGLTRKSLAHTHARLRATRAGVRYLSLPGYTAELLGDPAVSVDYHAQLGVTRAMTQALTAGERLRVTTAAGTELSMNITGRAGNCCPGFVSPDYPLGSPPDIEANVPPIESDSEGVVVVDGSVATESIGLLRAPLSLRIVGGRIASLTGPDAEAVGRAREAFERVGNPRAYVLAECGFGLNPAARLTGHMLTDEGAMGCVHFGFGSNATIGGANDVPFHLDFVVRAASAWVDGRQILANGEPVNG